VLAWTHWFDAFRGWSDDPERSIERTAHLVETARALDDALPDVYALEGVLHLIQGRHDAAVAAGEGAVARSPNHATNTALLGMILYNAGRPADAVRTFKRAMRLSPYYPAWFLEILGFSYLDVRQPGAALAAFGQYLERRPDSEHAAHAHVGRALAYQALDQEDAARAEVAKAIEADPKISLERFARLSLKKDRSGMTRGLAVLRRLGLPE
jgi:tetratricopeptide (TPR) repeat protein